MSHKNKYLFYVTLSYSFSILRPIAEQIVKNGGEYAWYIPPGSEAEAFILPEDNKLPDIDSVMAFNADALLAPGNYIPDFFPGIKVQVFHGFDSGKKNKFNIRGFFDLYCTQGANITEAFNAINDGTCEIVETGWGKLDALFTEHPNKANYNSDKPLVLYTPTFSPRLRSSYALLSEIERLSKEKDWQWLVKLHPKATKEEADMYKAIQSDKLTFIETADLIPLLQAADVLLSDTSSILAEFALQDKPVVAMNNRRPEPWMININKAEELEGALESAFNVTPEQRALIQAHCNAIHPYKDGQSAARTLQAIDSLIERGTSHLKRKPLNLIRRFKIRKELNYWRL